MLGCGSGPPCLRTLTVPRDVNKRRYDDINRDNSADGSIDTTVTVGVVEYT